MSWEDYVKEQLVGTGLVDEACLAGHDGNIWATSSGLGATPDQLAILVKAMPCPDGVQQNGFKIGDERYVFTSSDPGRIIRGRARSFKGGVHVCLTKQGRYSEPRTGGEAAKAVEKLADYLTSVGY